MYKHKFNIRSMTPAGTNHQKTIAIAIIGAAVSLAALSAVMPAPPGAGDMAATRSLMACTVLLSALYAASALWFLSGLKNLKTRLRISYQLFGLGLITLGVAMAQLPMIVQFNLWDMLSILGGVTVLGFILAALLFYLSMRQYALTLRLEGFSTSFLATSIIAVCVSIVAGMAATFLVQYEQEGVVAYMMAVACGMTYFYFASHLAFWMMSQIGTRYRLALKWQAIALLALALSATHEYFGSFVVIFGMPYQDYGFYLWPWVAAGFLLVRACYEFRLIAGTESAQNVPLVPATEVTDADYIDSIMAVASLASRPADLHKILDGMRDITANVASGASLTDEQKQHLLHMYIKVEECLIKDDPMQTRTVEEIREQLNPAFYAVLQTRPNKK